MYKVEVVLEYKSGKSRKLQWTELNPQVKEVTDGEETIRPATKEDLRTAIGKRLLEKMNDGAVELFNDAKTGTTIIVAFSEVYDIKVLIKENSSVKEVK